MKPLLNSRLLKVLVIIMMILMLPALIYTAIYYTNSKALFDEGTYSNTTYNITEGAVQLNNTFTKGTYTSKVIDPSGLANWHNLTWIEGLPYGEELRSDGAQEYILGDINMSGNVLLMHFNNDASYGESTTHVRDFSGNGYNGTINGDPSFVTGQFNNGISFTGADVNDWISIDYRAIDNLDDFTISLWLLKDTNSQEGLISGAGPSTDNELLIFPSQSNVRLYLESGNDQWSISIGDSKWHHMVFTREGTTATLYMDGVSAGSNAVSGNPLDISPGGFVIGQEQDSVAGGYASNQAYEGDLDELAIWSRVLSLTEIQNLYKRGVMRLNLSVKSCDDSACSGENWNKSFSRSPAILNVANNSYFQYKFDFETTDNTLTPFLYNVTTNYKLIDTQKPKIKLIVPLNNTVNDTNNLPSFLFNATDNYASELSCLLWMNETVSGTAQIKAQNISVLDGANTTITPILPLDENSYYWWINCTDGINNNISEKRILNITLNDFEAPIITLVSPANNTINTTNTSPKFTFNVTDNKASVLGCTLWMNDTISDTLYNFGQMSATEGIESAIVPNTTLENTNYTWWINCTDGANTNVSEKRNIKINVDRFAPNVTLLVPTDKNNSVNFLNTYLQCNATDDMELSNISLYTDFTGSWEKVLTKSLTSNSSSSNFTINLTSETYFKDTSYTWNCLAKDKFGKSNYSSSNYTFSNWYLGTHDNTTVNTDYTIDLSGSEMSGAYLSDIKDAGISSSWDNFSISKSFPYGEELPPYEQNESMLGGIDMTGNVLLMHLNEGPANNGASIGDYSGQNNNATFTTNNGATDKSVAGILGNAIQFDGNGDYIQSDGVSADVAGKDYTIMLWTKKTSTSVQEFVTAFNTNSGGNKLLFGTAAGNGNMQLYDTDTWHDTGVNIADGKWHLVGYVFKDSVNSVDIYIDGINVHTYSSIASVAANDRFIIGMEYDTSTPGDFWTGTVDEFSVWNRPLTQEEIENIYQRGIATLEIFVKSCDDSACFGESWQDTFSSTNDNLSVPDNRYFQYKVDLLTRDNTFSPSFSDIFIGHSISLMSDPIITVHTPQNNTNYFKDGTLYANFTSNMPLTYAAFYIDSNLSTKTDMTTSDTKNWYAAIGDIDLDWHNITFIYNTSYNNYSFTNKFELSNAFHIKVTKEIKSTNTDIYSINIQVENMVNGSRDIITLDTVDKNFNEGSFTPFYDIKETITGYYENYIYGWNNTHAPLQIFTGSYSITRTGPINDYYLSKAYRIGAE